MRVLAAILVILGLCAPYALAAEPPAGKPPAAPPDPAWGEWQPLAERLAADGMPQAELAALFASPRAQFDPQAMASKLRALLAARQRGMQGAAQGEPHAQPEVMESFLGALALAGAHAYQEYHSELLDRTERLYGVEKEIQVAMLLVETKLGMSIGEREAAVTLASMALSRDFERVRPLIGYDDLNAADQQWVRSRNADKAEWAYRELKALLQYARQAGVAPLSIPGSASGAIGQPQFMPSSALAYGVDGDGDGKVDLSATADAVCSLANYLKRHGWRPDLPRDRQVAVLLRYNQSEVYARTVLAAAARLKAWGN